ncbi:MAG TPA: hypothetical protein DGT21_11875 [Armatimonadetes bacterium]|nr:hypothetical protein [Armatimonadota bacterium]
MTRPFQRAHDLARFPATGGMSLEPAVTHRFSLDAGVQAFAMADAAHGGRSSSSRTFEWPMGRCRKGLGEYVRNDVRE